MKAFLLLCAFPLMALAQEPDWLLVAPQQLVAGERFELIVVAPPGGELPDTIHLRARVNVTELVLRAQAQGPALGARRRYAALMPDRAEGGPATLSLAERESNAVAIVIARREPVARPTPREPRLEEPPLSAEDPVYFVIGARQGWNARFQLSAKYRLFDTVAGFGAERPWLTGFYFGFTQNSLWDLSETSAPFRDTSYRPSFFWQWQRADERTWIDAVRVGYEHESNGRGGVDSRSINTLFTRPEWRWSAGRGGLIEFTPKFYVYVEKTDNPDIADYRGNVDLRLRHDAGGQWITTVVARAGKAGKGSVLVDLSRRTRDIKVGPLSGYLHLQFFNGFGESILDYNVRRKAQFRVGLAIVP